MAVLWMWTHCPKCEVYLFLYCRSPYDQFALLVYIIMFICLSKSHECLPNDPILCIFGILMTLNLIFLLFRSL